MIKIGLLASILASCVPSESTSTKKLIVLQGQSNCAQMTPGVNVGLDAAYPNVLMYEETAGAGPADPPVFTTEGPRSLAPRLVDFSGAFGIGTGGVELSMGRYLDTNGSSTYYIAKQAIDGSSLVNNWANAAYPTTGGSMMARSIAFIEARMTAWNITSGTDVTLIWIQGEADGGQSYATYLASLDTYFSTLRATLGNIKVIIVRTMDIVDTVANVRAAQESYCAVEANNARIYRLDDQTLRDTAHWDDDSTVNIGNGLGQLVLDMEEGTARTSPYIAAVGPITTVASTTSPTATMPAHQANDILAYTLIGNGTNNFATPAGWSEITDSPQAGGGLNPRVQVWWKRATDAATASPTITDVASDGSKSVFILVIRGCAISGNPFDVTAGDTAATSTSVSIPGDTSTVANGLAVGWLAGVVDLAAPQLGDWTNGDLTSLEGQVNFSSTSGAGVTAGVFSGRKATAGAFGATTATLTTTSAQARLMVVFKS